jgi:hypothetical protein
MITHPSAIADLRPKVSAMKGVIGRDAMEPSEYRAVNIPSCEPCGSPKYLVKGSRIRRLFNMELLMG